MKTDLEEMIRSMNAAERDAVEVTALAVFDAVKAAGAVSIMPAPAMPLTGILLQVHPKVYDRLQVLSKEGPPPSPETNTKPTGIVEVCPLCDIAGCKHLRGQPSPETNLEVKPLEWDDAGLSWSKAETPLGIYTVEPNGDWHFEQIGETARFGSPDAASARKDAEAHYHDRASSLFVYPSSQTSSATLLAEQPEKGTGACSCKETEPSADRCKQHDAENTGKVEPQPASTSEANDADHNGEDCARFFHAPTGVENAATRQGVSEINPHIPSPETRAMGREATD